MQLILLILAFMVVGYVLALTESKSEDKPVRLTDGEETPSNRLVGWWQARSRGRRLARQFKEWATGAAAARFDEDFKVWLVGLSGLQAGSFALSLSDYLRGLDYNLDQVMAGSLDKQPMLMSVFVEAIVVYSQAYRQAKQVKQEPKKKGDDAASQSESKNGKKPAEKSVSRRKQQNVPVAEAVPAT